MSSRDLRRRVETINRHSTSLRLVDRPLQIEALRRRRRLDSARDIQSIRHQQYRSPSERLRFKLLQCLDYFDVRIVRTHTLETRRWTQCSGSPLEIGRKLLFDLQTSGAQVTHHHARP